MPGWLKVLLIGAASGVLLFALAIGGFGWWLYSHRGEFREKGVAAEAKGTRFGVGKSSRACIDESLTRLERTSSIDFMQHADLEIFLRACLQSASRDPALCVGVPATGEIFPSVVWRNNTCAAHGKPGDQACGALLNAVQEVCHPAH
jgi:hypothetical protein